jgi:hypothetical protein
MERLAVILPGSFSSFQFILDIRARGTQDFIVSKGQGTFDSEARAAEKQASRARDAADLASGAKSREQLWAENTMIPARMTSFDIRSVPIPD